MNVRLRVNQLSVRYVEHSRPVFEDVSFDLSAGEILACVGDSGSGKSSLAKALMGLFDLNEVEQRGEIMLIEDADGMRPHPMAMIFQDPVQTLDPLMTVKQQCLELMKMYYPLWSGASKINFAQEQLKKVQLNVDDVWGKYPHQLSGGMCQRVGIALALLGDPLVLIADEPTTALDTMTQDEIMALLVQLKEEDGLACLLISHDVDLVERVADGVLSFEGKNDCGSQIESGMTRATAKVSSSVQSGGKDTMLSVSNLSCTYSNHHGDSKQVLDKISFALNTGEVLGIVGPSGSGKSTLKKCILGLISCEGNIDYMDLNPSDIQPIFQNPWAALNDKMTVKQQLLDMLKLKNISNENTILDVLEDVGLDESYLHRYASQMSGGQCQRVAIARALLLEPRVLIADEPTASLDASLREDIMKLLLSLRDQKGMSLMLISHDLEMLDQVADRVIVLPGVF